jgi:hypothetical protein
VNTGILILPYSQKKRPFKQNRFVDFCRIKTFGKGVFFCEYTHYDIAVFTEEETFPNKTDLGFIRIRTYRKGAFFCEYTHSDIAVFTEEETFPNKTDSRIY